MSSSQFWELVSNLKGILCLDSLACAQFNASTNHSKCLVFVFCLQTTGSFGRLQSVALAVPTKHPQT